MTSHVHNCIDDMLDRIANLERRLDDMEKSFSEHVLNDKVHIKHRSYKPIRRMNSPPPPPPRDIGGDTFGAPPKIRRAHSSPSRIRILPLPSDEARPKTPIPKPPPLPGKAIETKEEKADKLKF